MEYILKASAVIAIFYMFYKLLLQHHTFFIQNRWFLLAGLLVAFTIPMIVIPIYIEYTPVDLSNFTFENAVAVPVNSGLEWLDFVIITYGLGVMIFSIKFFIQIAALALVILRNKKTKHSKYTYVETQTNVSPFSFFKWIVYNPKQFNQNELDQIIEHEKVHANQYHSIDILFIHLTCIALWCNPFIWLYSKIVKQNLEFIADHNAQQKFNCKKSYQTTLLKTSLSSHQMTLSNNFYNSLIKKRIVMLHKSKSRKINQIKYVLVIPLLAVFLMSFNTEEIYIEKEEKPNKKDLQLTTTNQNSVHTYHILDNFKDTDFEEIKKLFKTKGYTLKISNLKRIKGLITSITIGIKNKTANADFNTSSLLPIKAIKIVLDKENNKISIGNLSDTDWKVVSGFPSPEKAAAYKNSKKLGNLIPENGLDNPLFVLNGKIVELKDIQDLNADDINSMNVLKGEKAIEKYGEDGKNEVIELSINTPIFKQNNRLVSSDSIVFIKKNTKDKNKSNDDPIMIGRSDSGIIIKGISDKNGKTPLIFLDGKEITEKEMRAVTPESIKEMKVLKGQNALDSYGERAKYGAIKLTTKGKTKSINSRPLDSTSIKTINLYDGKNPVYLVNGIAISKDEFSKLDTEQIHSVTVLKDEKAISYFGDKAKDGVIMIQKKESGDLDNGDVIITTKNSGNIIIRDTVKNKPLIILDGKEIDETIMKSLNHSNTSTITAFEGESALKKYGDKGKNGVIEIKTKNTSNTTIHLDKNKSPISSIGIEEGKEPIYLINGKVSSRTKALEIKSNNFKSIIALRGKEAVKKYGDKGKNGVIEIITKE